MSGTCIGFTDEEDIAFTENFVSQEEADDNFASLLSNELLKVDVQELA